MIYVIEAFCLGILVVLIPSGLILLYMIRYQTADDPNCLVIDGQVSDSGEGE